MGEVEHVEPHAVDPREGNKLVFVSHVRQLLLEAGDGFIIEIFLPVKRRRAVIGAYNCSPSFNWKKNLDDKTIASFQQQLSDMGYKYQFITLAGIHSMWFNMFDLAHAYAQGEGMRHYVEKVQQPEFAAGSEGYTYLYPMTDNCCWKLAMVLSSRFFFQLNDGEQL